MPDGTRAGGGMPGPTLAVHCAAAAIDARAADTPIGPSAATISRSVERSRATRRRLCRARLWFLRIDPEVGDCFGNEVRTVLLAKLQRV